MSGEEIFPVPTQDECLKDAPNPYRNLMHFFHFLSAPLYLLSVYVLVYKSPPALQKYRNYLLWHTIGNFVFEIYISIFMLPVTHLPYPVFQGSGLLKYINMQGLIQYNILVVCMIHTGLSVLEMFKYRFDVAVIEDCLNKKIIHRFVILFWIIVIAILIVSFGALPRCIPAQTEYKRNLWKKYQNQGISNEVLCDTSVTAPPLIDPVFTPIMTLIITGVLSATIVVPYTTLVILARLEKSSKRMSKKTIQLQKMLLFSLFIQTVIHAIMLGIPISAFIYAIVDTLTNNDIAYVFLLLVSFHGSVSTVVMIAFMKPIRQSIFDILKRVFPFCKIKLTPRVVNEVSSIRSTKVFYTHY